MSDIKNLIGESSEYDKKQAVEAKRPKSWLMERRGSGFKKILDAYSSYEKKPVFLSEHWGFTITFANVNYGSVHYVQENVQEKSREDKILALITDNNKISIKEIAEKLGVTPKTIQRDLDKMKDKNIISRIGADKGGFWEICKR